MRSAQRSSKPWKRCRPTISRTAMTQPPLQNSFRNCCIDTRGASSEASVTTVLYSRYPYAVSRHIKEITTHANAQEWNARPGDGVAYSESGGVCRAARGKPKEARRDRVTDCAYRTHPGGHQVCFDRTLQNTFRTLSNTGRTLSNTFRTLQGVERATRNSGSPPGGRAPKNRIQAPVVIRICRCLQA